MSTSTAVAPLAAPTDNALEQIRQRGASEVAHRREVEKLFRQIEGTQWGGSLSVAARGLIAEFAKITRANILTHVDLLGGKPYLNERYWSDLAANHPLHHHYEQRDLSPSVEAALRERAKRHRDAAGTLPADDPERAERIKRALNAEDEADDIALARAKWSPRPTATCVIETTVYRYTNAALAAIQDGRTDGLEVVTVTEANWAGGHGIVKIGTMDKKDPIGDANPGTTARSRSLRRALVKSYSAWMSEYDAQIGKAEDYLEAEYEIVSTQTGEIKSSLQIGDGGEVSAPDETPVIQQAVTTQAALPVQESAFDFEDARKKLMATFADSGIKSDKDRKAWLTDHGFPASTKEFSPEQYRDAWKQLVEPTRDAVRAALGGDEGALEDLALRILQKPKPSFLKDWKALLAALEAQPEPDEQDGEQAAFEDL